MWSQTQLRLTSKRRGFHLVTDEILQQLPNIQQCRIGLLHLLLQHTSASLSLNENADPTVRHDLNAHLEVLAPENAPGKVFI
jgi:secondary thiamine-phosphate synthase enzyme